MPNQGTRFLKPTYPMDVLVNVAGVLFSAHHLIDGRTTLLFLAMLLCGSHPARPKLERKGARYCECKVFNLSKISQVVSERARIHPRQPGSSI